MWYMSAKHNLIRFSSLDFSRRFVINLSSRRLDQNLNHWVLFGALLTAHKTTSCKDQNSQNLFWSDWFAHDAQCNTSKSYPGSQFLLINQSFTNFDRLTYQRYNFIIWWVLKVLQIFMLLKLLGQKKQIVHQNHAPNTGKLGCQS